MVTYNIYSWSDLSQMRSDLSGDYILKVNLNKNSPGYTNIGDEWENYFPGTGAVKANLDFRGTFDGQGHTISDLKVNGSVTYAGFIGFFTGAFVRNLVLKNCNIEGDTQVGLIGSLRGAGEIYNCGLVGGSITATSRVGLVGWQGAAGGIVHDCYNNGCIITALAAAIGEAGGIVGQMNVNLYNCWSNAVINSVTYAGGLVGRKVVGEVSNSFWDTQVSGIAVSDGGVGKTTTEMKNLLTYSSWDIVLKSVHDGKEDTAIWFIDDGEDYPRLWFEYVKTLGSFINTKINGSIVKGLVNMKSSGNIIQPPVYIKVGGSLIKL